MSSSLSECRVVVDKVSHVYPNGKRALNDITLDIGVGLFGLLGANGAGKSTLMRILCTLLEHREGSVSIAGHDVLRGRQQARRLIGYLPQEFGAWPGYTVSKSLDILAALSGIDDRETRGRRVEEVLESVGLSKVSLRKVKHLSGGMLRRLGIAQAIVHDPKVLVMDEPTVGLDPEERLRFRQLIAELSRDRVVVLSTHIVADLGASCSTIALIHEGQVEFLGAPNELVEKARGKVMEVSCSPVQQQELDLSEDFEVVARTFKDGNSVLRGVANPGFVVEDALAAENITLEEAHLAFTLEKGRDVPDSE